jgi:hypothetical protein
VADAELIFFRNLAQLRGSALNYRFLFLTASRTLRTGSSLRPIGKPGDRMAWGFEPEQMKISGETDAGSPRMIYWTRISGIRLLRSFTEEPGEL